MRPAIFIGFQTRWAAFIASGEMAVAYFQVHWHFQFNQNFFPAVNKGEPAALYCFVFLYIATRGGVMLLPGKEEKGIKGDIPVSHQMIMPPFSKYLSNADGTRSAPYIKRNRDA